MPHSRICTFGVVLLFVAALGAPLFAVEPSEKLLPDTTKGFLSATNMKVLVDHWNETQIGQLMQDPIMEPFRKDVETIQREYFKIALKIPKVGESKGMCETQNKLLQSECTILNGHFFPAKTSSMGN